MMGFGLWWYVVLHCLRELIMGKLSLHATLLKVLDKSLPRLKAWFYLYNTTTKMAPQIANKESMQKALAELVLYLKPNITKIVKK